MGKGSRVRALRKARGTDPVDFRVYGIPLEDGQDDLVVVFTEAEQERYNPPMPLMNAPLYQAMRGVGRSYTEISATEYYRLDPSLLEPSHQDPMTP